jgi:protein TonB
MNTNREALLISLALHGTVLFLVYALSMGFAQSDKPIRIDFTLDNPAPGPAAPKAPQKTPQKAPAKQVVSSPRSAAREVPKPSVRPSAPLAPATEVAGPVPIAAARRESLPVPGATYSNEGGTTTEGTTGPASTGNVGGSAGVGGGGGGGANPDQLRSKYRKEHFEYIRRIIQENMVYPERAQRNGWEGQVVVMFSVMQNGRVKDIRIRKSCGYGILDENVLETIRKVEPFPRPPVAVELIIPVIYRL